MKLKHPAGFLNVDLVIESSVTLEPMVLEFGKKVLVLYSGPVRGKRWLLNLETSRPTSTPDGAAWALCAVVERLSCGGRKLWEGAMRREFDFGFEMLPGVRSLHCAIQPRTLTRIAALGGTVAFSCYRDDGGANDMQGIKK